MLGRVAPTMLSRQERPSPPDGAYTTSADHAAAFRKYYLICERSCNAGGGADPCVETGFLNQMNPGDSSLIGAHTLIYWCDQGDSRACAWVERHGYIVARAAESRTEDRARREAARVAASRAAADAASDPIPRVAQEVTDRFRSQNGMPAVSDSERSLANGAAVYLFRTQPGTHVSVVVLGRTRTSFTALARLPNGKTIPLDAYDFEGVRMRSKNLTFDDNNGGQLVRVEIQDDGGDRGRVRVLHFERAAR